MRKHLVLFLSWTIFLTRFMLLWNDRLLSSFATSCSMFCGILWCSSAVTELSSQVTFRWFASKTRTSSQHFSFSSLLSPVFQEIKLTNVGLRSILMVCQSSMQVLSTVFLFQGYQCWKISLISLLIFSLISVPISKEIFLLFFLMVTNPSKGTHNSLNPVTVYFANYRCPVKYAGMASLWPLKDKATCCCFSYCCCFVILSPTIFVPMQTFLYM